MTTPTSITVHVSRWRASGWRWWNRGGLFLSIEWPGTDTWCTQTYRSRSLDDAREMVIDYLHCRDVPVPDDVVISWVDGGG